MTYATAMVSLAVGQPNEALLEVSGQLAAQCSAKVIGVAAAMFSPPMYFLEGAASQQLLDQGEAAIAKLMTSGEIVKIYDKWFMNPIPPKGLNLNMPLSDEMKALYKSPNDKAFE